MAYYLAVENKPNDYEAIKIKETGKEKELFPDEDDCPYKRTLTEIDAFTMQYPNLGELTYALYTENKIQWPNNSLSIIYVNDNKIRIEQTILFRGSKKYIEDQSKIRDYISKKYKNLDINFFRELSKSLLDTDPIKEVVDKIIGEIEKHLVYEEAETSPEVISLLDALIYQTDSDGKIIVPHELCYEKTRVIASFIAMYEEEMARKNKNVRKKESHKK